MRYYRANQAVMDKASMLYNRFKNAYLLGEGEEVVSTAFLRSLLQEKEREEAERCRDRRSGQGAPQAEVARAADGDGEEVKMEEEEVLKDDDEK